MYNIVNDLLESDIIVDNNFIDEETLADAHSRTGEDGNLCLSKPEDFIDNAEKESENLGK